MTISETLLPEYDQEIANTRQFLERVPAQDAAWRPHPKSATLGALAVHVATIPAWVAVTLLAVIALRLGRKLAWNADREQFAGDGAAEANAHLAREMRPPYDYSLVS